jgi:hypothetical protein
MDFAKFRRRLSKRWNPDVMTEMSMLRTHREWALVRDDVFAVNVKPEHEDLTSIENLNGTEVDFSGAFPTPEFVDGVRYIVRQNPSDEEAFVWTKWLAYCKRNDIDPGAFEPAMYPHPLGFYEPSDDEPDDE